MLNPIGLNGPSGSGKPDGDATYQRLELKYMVYLTKPKRRSSLGTAAVALAMLSIPALLGCPDTTQTVDPEGAAAAEIGQLIQFDVAPATEESAESPANREFVAYAFTSDGSPLPDANYHWTIDGTEDAGPVDTHATRQISLARAGTHRIALAVTLAGITFQAGCQSSGEHEARIAVDPTLRGRVADAAGAPIPGALVAAGARRAATDAAGRYELLVPYGWAGDVVVQPPGELADLPAAIKLAPVEQDQADVDFIIGAAGDTVTAESLAVELAPGEQQVITLSGTAGSNAPYGYVITGLTGGLTVVDDGNDYPIGPSNLPYRLVNGGNRLRCIAGAEFGGGTLSFRATDGSALSEVAAVEIILPGGVVVSGTVKGPNGSGLAGVEVEFKADAVVLNRTYRTVTNGAGKFTQRLPADFMGTLTLKNVAQVQGEHPVRLDCSEPPVSPLAFTARRTIIVATDGSPGAAGTLADPLRTVQEALDRAVAGDIVYIRQGEYTEAALTFARSGELGAPITVASYPGETATLTAGTMSKPVFDFTSIWGGAHQAGFGHLEFLALKLHHARDGWMVNFAYNGEPLAVAQQNALHDILIQACEIYDCESAIKTRNAGVHRLTVIDTDVHDCIGTEGGWDFGEWPDGSDLILVPRSASRDITFIRCDSYNNNINQQSCGFTFQPCTSNVTMRECRSFNNGKYGFACKGSGGYRLDRCAAWANRATGMYCRGMATIESGTPRQPYMNDFVLTNCVFVAPADQEGGAALNIRENATVAAYNCTIVGLRDNDLGGAGGYPLLQGQHHELTSTLALYNCVVVGFIDAPAVRMYDGGPPSADFMCYTRFLGSNNLYFSNATTAFKYQHNNWPTVAQWRAYWASGEPNGDDATHGPRATHADESSLFAAPEFRDVDPHQVPLALEGSSNFLNDHLDLRPSSNSPMLGAGKNLSSLKIPELTYDYLGQPRPMDGGWTIGAFQRP